VIIQEDLGDRQLFRVYEEAAREECDEYKERAVNLIAQIQKATEAAYEKQSIASRLALMKRNFPGSWIFLLSITLEPKN